MTAPVILTIVIGLAIIGISFVISERNNNDVINEFDEEFADQQVEKVTVKVEEKVDEILDSKSEEYIEKTDGELSKVSNEKIMAFHEYSEQVFEKIDQNHNEVVFLYDMLNNKEQELKETVREVNNAKKEIEQQKKIIEEQQKTIEESKKELEETKKSLEATVLSANNIPNISEIENTQAKELKNVKEKEDKMLAQEKAIKAAAKKKEKEESRDKKNDEEVQAMLDMDDYNEFVEQNNNEEILTMYEAGKSVIEISKELGIGQGEVKLVINLYKGINRK